LYGLTAKAFADVEKKLFAASCWRAARTEVALLAELRSIVLVAVLELCMCMQGLKKCLRRRVERCAQGGGEDLPGGEFGRVEMSLDCSTAELNV
jgi:hypothetical protein